MKKLRKIIFYEIILIITLTINYFYRPYFAIGGEFFILPLIVMINYLYKNWRLV